MHEFAIDTSSISSTSFKVIGAENISTDTDPSTNLYELMQSKIEQRKHFFGIEISPTTNFAELDYSRFGESQPLFTSITWLMDHNLKYDSLSIAPAVRLAHAVEKCNPVLMHVTCYQMNENKLQQLLDNKFTNFLALRGDLQASAQRWNHAIDLVKAIRERSECATIVVAAYPEVHSEAISRADDLKFLKGKVDAGANFIVTNTCFSFECLSGFIKACRAIDIMVPIVVGVYIPSSYDELMKMCDISRINVPEDQLANYRLHRNDRERFAAYASENAETFLKRIFNLDAGERIYGVHFFTLNRYDHIYDIVRKFHFS